MGFQFVVMFIGSFVDDVGYVRNVEFCQSNVICCMPEYICYGSESFGLGSLPDDRWTCWHNPTVLFRSSI